MQAKNMTKAYKKNQQTYTPFGLEAKKRMLDKNIKNYELAEKIGVPHTYVSQIIRGERGKSKYIPQIAEILGIDLEEYAI